MSFGTALVVIVAIIAYTVLKMSRHNARHPHEVAPPADDADARREIADLKERIKVLERIATDGHTLDASETRRIAAEIESLREKQG